MIVAGLILVVLAILFPKALRFLALLLFLGLLYVFGQAIKAELPDISPAIERSP